LLDFVDKSLDMYRHEQTILLYPIFVHLYLLLVLGGHPGLAKRFFSRYHDKQEMIYHDELVILKSLNTIEQAQRCDIVDMYRKNKFTTRMSRDAFQSLLKHLQVNQHHDIIDIINKQIHIDGKTLRYHHLPLL
jgi:transcription initiation factor TFIID subunit 5